MQRIVKLVSFLLISLTISVKAAEPVAANQERLFIQEIRFEGNSVTQESVFYKEIQSRENQFTTLQQINADRQSIHNTGLFRSVRYRLKKTPGQGLVLTFVVTERRFYWYALPDFSRNSDGDISYGFDVDISNLFGLDHELDFEYEKTKFDSDRDRDNEEKVSFKYLYRNVANSDYDLSFFGLSSELDIDEERDDLNGSYQLDLNRLGTEMSRWFEHKDAAQGQGVNLTAGLTWEDYTSQFVSGDSGLFFDAELLILNAGIKFSDVDDHEFYRSGTRFGYGLQTSSRKWGSDRSFTHQDIFIQRYIPLSKTSYENINWQVRAAYANQTIFGDPAFAVGGGRFIRGFNSEDVEGDFYWIFNVEYIRSILGHRTLRGVLFTDVGNAFENIQALDDDVRGAVGLGLRWKLRSFVNTDLRLDYGFGFGSGSQNKIFFGTRATF